MPDTYRAKRRGGVCQLIHTVRERERGPYTGHILPITVLCKIVKPPLISSILLPMSQT